MKTDLEFTERDWKLLRGLEKWGVLGLGQALGLGLFKEVSDEERVRLFFNETTRREYGLWYAKRVRLMARRGFVLAHSMVNERVIYTLSETGFECMKSRGRNTMPGFRDEIAPLFVDHELKVAAVGLVLSELFGLNVRVERERYIWRGRGGWSPAPRRGISDLWIVDDEAPRAIEVELTQKSQKQYAEIFGAYKLRRPRSSFALCYLTGWPNGVRTILSHAAAFQADFVYACGLQEFRDSLGCQPFRGALDGQSVSLMPAAAIPGGGPAHRRVESTSLPARADCVVPAGRLVASPFAPPSQLRIGGEPR